MKAILNFLGFKKGESKKAHTYRTVRTSKGSYTRREDGLEFYISDLLK